MPRTTKTPTEKRTKKTPAPVVPAHASATIPDTEFSFDEAEFSIRALSTVLEYAVKGYLVETADNLIDEDTADNFQRGVEDTTEQIRDLAKAMLEREYAARRPSASTGGAR